MTTTGKLDELVRAINKEFNRQVPPVAPEAEQKDRGSEFWDETGDLWGKTWGDITLNTFERNTYIFFFIPFSSLPFFFGAFMKKSIEQNDYEFDSVDNFLSGVISDDDFYNPFKFFSKHGLYLILEYLNVRLLHLSDEGDKEVTLSAIKKIRCLMKGATDA